MDIDFVGEQVNGSVGNGRLAVRGRCELKPTAAQWPILGIAKSIDLVDRMQDTRMCYNKNTRFQFLCFGKDLLAGLNEPMCHSHIGFATGRPGDITVSPCPNRARIATLDLGDRQAFPSTKLALAKVLKFEWRVEPQFRTNRVRGDP